MGLITNDVIRSLEGETETIQGLPKTLTQQLIEQVRQ